MAKVIENHAADNAGEGHAWPIGVLAGKFPSIEIADIKAARQEALLGSTNKSRPTGEGRSTKGK